MATKLICIALALALAGCCTPPDPIVRVETITVDRPVPVRASPPAELQAHYTPASMPVFIEPTAKGAAVALDEKGIQDLREVLTMLKSRNDAWLEWANKLDGR